MLGEDARTLPERHPMSETSEIAVAAFLATPQPPTKNPISVGFARRRGAGPIDPSVEPTSVRLREGIDHWYSWGT